MKVAITGINGYLGKEFKKFLCTDCEIIGLSSKPKDDEIKFDLYNSIIPEKIEADVMIHLSWLASNGTEKINQLNFENSKQLFLNAKKSGVKKIIFISSMSSHKGALSNYGKTKFKFEGFCKDIGAIIVRPGLVIDKKNPGGTYLQLLNVTENKKFIPVISDGSQLQYLVKLEKLLVSIKFIATKRLEESPPPFSLCEVPAKTLKELIVEINKDKNIFFISIPFLALYWPIKLLEMLNISIKPSSDSLKGLVYYNREKIIPYGQ